MNDGRAWDLPRRMKSEFLLGVLGFLVVFFLLAGGAMAAGALHNMLTGRLEMLYMVWLWICLIPFWWIIGQMAPAESIAHPIATYVLLLPFMLLCDALIPLFGPGNLWIAPFLAVCGGVYFTLGARAIAAFHKALKHAR
jgi:hypothetical protein